MRCKKIILGFGSSMYGEHEIDFTLRYLAQPKMLLVGAVLTDLQEAADLPVASAADSADRPGIGYKKGHRDRNRLYKYLQEQCKEMGAKGVVHQENGCSTDALMQETRYADLLVLSQETYLAITREPGARPVSLVLEQCHCPVLVLPSEQASLEQVVMTFDGSSRAMDGIKQFAYLLGEVAQQLPVTVLTTYSNNHIIPAAEEKLFIEYLKQHFSNVGIHRLCEGTEHTLKTAVGLNENALVVVNNPSPQSLPLLRRLLHSTANLHGPLRLFTHGTTDAQGDLVNV